MNRAELIERITNLILDDKEVQSYLDRVAQGDPNAPEDSESYALYYSSQTCTLSSLVAQVVANLYYVD